MNHVIHATAETNSKGAHHYLYSQTNQRTPRVNHHQILPQTDHINCRVVQTRTLMQATSITTAQRRSTNHPNHTHKNLGTRGNSSSTSRTPLCKQTLTHATLRHATTNTSTRPCCSSHETATTLTQTCTTTLHHQTGKQSTSSYGSHGQGHGQAPKLQTANEQPKIQNSIEPVSSQQIRATGKWHQRAHQKPHQHNRVHLRTQDTGRPQKRRHIRAIRMLSQTQKGQTQPNVIHGRRQQNQLPQQSSQPNRRNASGHNALQ
jgi:hypothetical protein